MIPDFLAMAIQHEKNLIELRKRQIEGYEKRIKLMEGGLDYYEALNKVPPVSSGLKFEKEIYLKAKKKYESMKKNV